MQYPMVGAALAFALFVCSMFMQILRASDKPELKKMMWPLWFFMMFIAVLMFGNLVLWANSR